MFIANESANGAWGAVKTLNVIVNRPTIMMKWLENKGETMAGIAVVKARTNRMTGCLSTIIPHMGWANIETRMPELMSSPTVLAVNPS